MLKKVALLLTSFLFSNLHAVLVGNPSAPELYTCGLISKNQILYLRCGYFYDNIYHGEYKEEEFEEISSENQNHSLLKLRTQGALITANIKNRWDIYSMLGSAKMNLDNQISTTGHFSWCVGTRVLLLRYKNFDLGIDGKYSQTLQDSDHLIIDDKVLPIITENFGFKVEQYQAFLGISYKIDMFVPYVGTTYLYSTIRPYSGAKHLSTTRGLFRYPYPNEDLINDFIYKNNINSHKWGFTAGVTIISNNMVSVNVETRLVDQDAVNVSAEIRF